MELDTSLFKLVIVAGSFVELLAGKLLITVNAEYER
jgi:hypothetical protein